MLSDTQKIKEDLKRCYGEIAEEFSQSRKAYWPEFQFFLSYIPENTSLLDAGCGDGRFMQFLKDQKRFVNYTGMDFSPELLRIAKKKFPKEDFVEADMSSDILPKRFDRILCCAAFHHIPGKTLRKKTLRNFSHMLKDEGLLLLSVWNLWQLKYIGAFARSILHMLFFMDPRDVFIPFGKKKNLRYYHAFLPWEMRSLLQECGFVIERTEISRHNFVFVCRKNLLKATPQKIFAREKFAESLETGAIAICHREH